ncbi:MAG: PaaI family thioesterase [Clostridia bacterium]|nr:PaaI family thioesterase [Clostridia bacterium]
MTENELNRLKSYLTEIYSTNILEKFLDVKIVEISEGKAVYQMKIKPEHSNMFGIAHGGILASIADIIMGIPCFTLGKSVVTIDMNINFIKSVPLGTTITGIGQVTGNGNKIMRTIGKIFNEENQLVAQSQGSYYVTGEFNLENYL